MFDRYFQAAGQALGEVAATQGQSLEAAARLVALVDLEQAEATAASSARVAELLLEQGHAPPVLASQSLDGRRAAERNAELLRPDQARTGRQP